MANQYHDELGRFCSRNEMGEAVDRLFTLTTAAPTEAERAVASEQWFNLKNEYTALLSKPEPIEEKLEAFLDGVETRQPTDDWTKGSMLEMLDERTGPEGAEKMRKLIAETDFTGVAPARTLSILKSTKLSLDEKYALATRARDGLKLLLQVEPGYVLADPEKERALIASISGKNSGDYGNEQVWTVLAKKSVLPETRRLILDEAKDDFYSGLNLPAVYLGQNLNLTKEEAVEMLEIIAEHQPEKYTKAEQNLRPDVLNVDKLLNSYRTDGNGNVNREYPEFQTWRLEGFELAEAQAELDALRREGEAIAAEPGWDHRPSLGLALGNGKGHRFNVLQVRLDANNYKAINTQYQELDRQVRSRKFKKESYDRRHELLAARDEAGERRDAAYYYARRLEAVAQVRAALTQKA